MGQGVLTCQRPPRRTAAIQLKRLRNRLSNLESRLDFMVLEMTRRISPRLQIAAVLLAPDVPRLPFGDRNAWRVNAERALQIADVLIEADRRSGR